jgi:hypothetical protein
LVVPEETIRLGFNFERELRDCFHKIMSAKVMAKTIMAGLGVKTFAPCWAIWFSFCSAAGCNDG